jgi:cytochrome c oxidase assembly protein subunit 15
MDVASSTTARAGVAAWLGLLFCLVFTLNTAGGWVRLSGSGVAIPHWPVIELGNGWTLLPPFSDQGWQEMYGQFNEHQARLQARVEAGELTTANLGRQPRDHDEFRTMFLTEWSHRFLAAVTGLVAAGVIVTALRRRELRTVAGVPLSIAGVLIVAQAVLGGLLVSQGTNTHWLFLHQGNAGLIMAAILWAILRLLADGRPAVNGRQGLRWLVGAAMVAIWFQLVLGALVAGSRHNAQGEVQLSLSALPHLWESRRGLSWNLLDNGWLHLWIHRWWAWTLSVLLAASFVVASRTPMGLRGRLALQVSATFLVLQLVFGFASAALGALPFLALGHQALGMCLLLSVVLAWHDTRFEPTEELAVETPGVPA